MAFLQSAPPREPFLHAPPSVLWLIGALVLAHIARILAPAPIPDDILLRYAFDPASYSVGAGSGGSIALAIPFVSYMFLHADFVHLSLNCVWLLVFGSIVARRYGTGLFFLFFIVCGIAGISVYLALNWGSPERVIGASGGISGLMAVGIRMYRWPGPKGAHSLAPILSSPILLFTGLWIATNLLAGLTGFGGEGEIHQIAWQAHLGGYFAGLFLPELFDALYRRNRSKSSDPD